MDDTNPYASPQVSEELAPLLAELSDEVWSDGKRLVMHKQAGLPDRCVKCNAPAEGIRLKRKLAWHPQILFVLILINIWIYFIVALIVQKKAKIEIGLCPEHVDARRRTILVSWLVFIVGACLFVSGFFLIDTRYVGLIFLASLATVLGAGIYGGLRARTVTPARIDHEYVWLKGVCPEYLDGLPPWVG